MQNVSVAPITILIADDCELNRVGVSALLESVEDFEIIGSAPDGKQSVDLSLQLKPTIVLMDVRMPILDGIGATKQIKENSPETKIIMLTSHSDHALVMSALEAGADGYCLKSVRSAQLILAIRAVACGAGWLDPGIADIILRPSTYSINEEKLNKLDADDMAILRLIVDGLDNQQIAKRLSIGYDSVKVHIKKILKYMAAPNRTQAAVKAVRQGIV